MGYTHYWDSLGKLTVDRLSLISSDVRKIVEFARQRGIEIGAGDGDGGDPEISDSLISLNGVESDSHETLYLGDDSGFAFCKTARKSYDVVVTAILAIASHRGVIHNVRSDGDSSDWTNGVALACQVTGEEIPNPIQDAR